MSDTKVTHRTTKNKNELYPHFDPIHPDTKSNHVTPMISEATCYNSECTLTIYN